MTRYAIFVSAVLAALPAVAQPQCTQMTGAARSALTEYVQKKFRLPADAKLELTELSFVEKTCYRNLRFQSHPGSKSFQMDLIASPDLKFLAREWMDIRVDPIEEERKKQATLLDRLTTGTFAEKGPKDATVTITIFSDFQCPYCAQMAKGLMNDILPSQEQKIRVIFRNFPLSMHSWALLAAEGAACAQQQGEQYFWEMHDYLFSHQKRLTPDGIKSVLFERASTMGGLDLTAFMSCLNDGRTGAAVEADIALGTSLGVTGTPTIFVGAERITGYKPEQIRTLLRELSTPVEPTAVSPHQE